MPGAVRKTAERPAPPPMGELTTEIHINVAEIPDHVRDGLAAAALDLVRGILRQPGGREALDAQIQARKERLKRQQEASWDG